ncbi:MAG: S8 family serine peptidase [Marinifilum sp.]|jgi:subtilisin family serine protease|nr:S8 family serine peptidase [Marinifilum sp.]
MKKYILSVIILFSVMKLHAQEKLNYQLNGKNIEFSISKNEIYVEFETTQKNTLQRTGMEESIKLGDNSAILKMTELKNTYQERKQSLENKTSTDFQRIEPILVYKDGTQQIANGELNIKLKDNVSLSDVLKGINYTFEPNEFDKNLYLVKLGLETFELFKLVNQLQKDNKVEYVEPNFIRMLQKHTSDPFFSFQWAINNQGYLGGNVDADMDVDEAWQYATGNEIKVAIIDEGVDLSHPDLISNLLSGFDATGGNSNGGPNKNTDDYHGTSCAGIVAAVRNNNIGIAGIAYNSKIIPVRIAYTNGYPLGDSRRGWITNDNWIANGINWAWQNGADVLSNSWGGGSYSTTISNAINNAINNGRNGKGSIVLFSSGNNNGAVSFPATLDNVVAVGASSMCDERKTPNSCDGETWWGSNYGEEIDVIAPGVKIYTTDISGSDGYNNGDYKSDFNGTSSACPNAAGVAALILSINPNFTMNEVRQLLEKSTDKVPNYNYSTSSIHPNGTWNNQVGYGRLNAANAVKEAFFNNVSINGSNLICSSSSTYSINNLPSGTTVTWTSSSNIIFPSGNTGSSISARAYSSTSSGAGWIEATINGVCGDITLPRKEVWVGKPSFTLTGDRELDPGMPGIVVVNYTNGSPVGNSASWSYSGPLAGINGDIYKAKFRAEREGGYGSIYLDLTGECGIQRRSFGFKVTDFFPIRVYPNPANQYTVLELSQALEYQSANGMSIDKEVQDSEEYEIQIWHERYGLVKQMKSSDKKLQIPTNNLDEGIYFLHVIVNGKVHKQQLKIQR